NIFKEFLILRLDVLVQVMADLGSWDLVRGKRMGIWNHDNHRDCSPVIDSVIQDLLYPAFRDPGIDGVSISMVQEQNRIRFLRALIVAGRGIDQERTGY